MRRDLALLVRSAIRSTSVAETLEVFLRCFGGAANASGPRFRCILGDVDEPHPVWVFIILKDTRGETGGPILGSIVPGPSLLTGWRAMRIVLFSDNMLHASLPL